MKKLTVIMVLLVFAVAVQCYGETDDPDNIWCREKLSGDWGGFRSDLAEHGINIDVKMIHYQQGVTSGGANTNGAYGGKFDYLLNVDGEKAGLGRGFFVTLHAETQFGNSLVGDAGAFSFPNTSMLYPLPDYRGTAITGLLFQQALSENFVLAGGKINVLDLWTMMYPHTGGRHRRILEYQHDRVSFAVDALGEFIRLGRRWVVVGR